MSLSHTGAYRRQQTRHLKNGSKKPQCCCRVVGPEESHSSRSQDWKEPACSPGLQASWLVLAWQTRAVPRSSAAPPPLRHPERASTQSWPLPAISGQPSGTCLCAGVLQGLQWFGAGNVSVGQPFSRWTPAWRASSLSTSTDSRPPSPGHSLCTPSRLSSSLFKSRCRHWRRKTFYKC